MADNALLMPAAPHTHIEASTEPLNTETREVVTAIILVVITHQSIFKNPPLSHAAYY
jgi:hypothetical protein